MICRSMAAIIADDGWLIAARERRFRFAVAAGLTVDCLSASGRQQGHVQIRVHDLANLLRGAANTAHSVLKIILGLFRQLLPLGPGHADLGDHMGSDALVPGASNRASGSNRVDGGVGELGEDAFRRYDVIAVRVIHGDGLACRERDDGKEYDNLLHGYQRFP